MLGIVVLITLVILVLSVVVDIAYTVIDPRVRPYERREAAAEGRARTAEAPRPAVTSPG